MMSKAASSTPEADTPTEREILAQRLQEADLLEARLIDVENGGKASKVLHSDPRHRRSGFDSLSGNYGVYAGATPGGEKWLIDVDIDDYNPEADNESLEAVNDLPETFTVASPHTDGDTGGHRYYLIGGKAVHETIESFCGAKNPGMSWGEIRVHNQYVVGPGSALESCDKGWHDCGEPGEGRYTVAQNREIAEITLPELFKVLEADGKTGHTGESSNSGHDQPEKESDTSHAKAVAEHYSNISDYLMYGSDDRSKSDFHVVCRFIEHGVPESEAYTLLANNSNSKVDAEDASDDYWRRTWGKAIRKVGDDAGTETVPNRVTEGGSGDTNPTLSPTQVEEHAGLGEDESISDLTDRKKAATVWKLVRQSDEYHVRVRKDNDSLWAYDDGIWKPQGERVLRHAARRALGAMEYGQNVLSELKAQVRSDPLAEINPESFGVDTGTIATENGLVHLDPAAHGGDALEDLKPEHYALARINAEYDPNATYSEWQEYVEEWAEDGWADALQEYVGYCLHVGAMPIDRALMLVGSGANGKGTFLSVVRTLLGPDNTSSIELQTLANERDAVADFYGSLANIDDDLSPRKLGQGLGMFKKLVAGDRVRGRHLYEEGFEFDATGKHLYAANEVPQVDVSDEDEAFWRRWILVEFPNHYPPSERDPGLRKRFTEPEALSGVLNWAIKGWSRLIDQGHFTNEEQYAQAKRERWQAWGESVDKFISECVTRDEDADRITTTDAHRRYAAWCRENGEDPASQQKFTNTLKNENVGYKQSLRVNGEVGRGYEALALSDDVPPLEETPERGTTDTQERLG